MIASLSTCIALALIGGHGAEPPPPNFVIIFVDDQGYADVGVQGCSDYETPHIDSIASGGVQCTAGYVAQPLCAASRAGLMTGRHPSRFGHEANHPHVADPDFGLPLEERTLAEYLRDAGYATGMIGKWHLGKHISMSPMNRGFLEAIDLKGSFESREAEDAFDAAESTERTWYPTLWRNMVPEPMNGYVADRLADEAVDFVEHHRNEPFLLYWAHPFPHIPTVTEDKYLERVSDITSVLRRRYAAMMLAVDDGVGRILEALRRNGLEENTLVFYITDNGGAADRSPASNGPLTGGKGGLQEGGIRVTYLAQWKGVVPGGRVYDPAVTTLDVVPTVLAAAGIATPDGVDFDGVDLLPFWTGRATGLPHERLFWRRLHRDTWAIREGDWKLLALPGLKPPRLYHLADDIGERNDLARLHPDRVRSMTDTYEAWAGRLPQPRWVDVFDGD